MRQLSIGEKRIEKKNILFVFIFNSYELQISEKYQGNGIGEFLLKTLEEIAKAWRMEKVILTALTNNERALKFYRNLNYTADKSNPIDEKSYVILSKYV